MSGETFTKALVACQLHGGQRVFCCVGRLIFGFLGVVVCGFEVLFVEGYFEVFEDICLPRSLGTSSESAKDAFASSVVSPILILALCV